MNFAIDENVIAVANDVSRVLCGQESICPQADDNCRLRCVEFLSSALKSGRILLDDADTVFSYYRRKASLSGQPGSGDAFLKVLFQSSYDPERTVRVGLPDGPGFGLPNVFTSCGFDPDDMIYVALAMSSPPAEVVNAVDSDYAQYAVEIAALGVSVRQLCI